MTTETKRLIDRVVRRGNLDLARLIDRVVRRGNLDLAAIETYADVELAKRFSPHLRHTVEGASDADVYTAMLALKAQGERKFCPGVGLWLTDGLSRKGE